MSESQWLPQFTTAQLAQAPTIIRYKLKTLLVSAEAEFLLSPCAGSVTLPSVSLRASAKIPLKDKFAYQATAEVDCVAISSSTNVWFKNFSEGGFGEAGFHQWTAGSDGLTVDSNKVTVPLFMEEILSVAHMPYILWNANRQSETLYLGLMFGRALQLVQLRRQLNASTSDGETYAVRALPLASANKGAEQSFEKLDWSKAYPAEILIKNGILEAVEVTAPLVGRISMRRRYT